MCECTGCMYYKDANCTCTSVCIIVWRTCVPHRVSSHLLCLFHNTHTSSSALLLTHISLCVSRLQVEEEAVVKLCLQNLSLRSLSKEPSVSYSQMILCCKRLLEQRSPLMQGLHVCISHFYSVMQDGDLCVPWDWKSWVGGTRSRAAGLVWGLERSIFSSLMLCRQQIGMFHMIMCLMSGGHNRFHVC